MWAIQGDPDQSEYRYAAKDIKDGPGQMLPAARTRGDAVHYGFIVLSIGLIVIVSVCGSAPSVLCVDMQSAAD